jgi:HAD superfamily phosphoserine phosphatase-like hydrolase
MKYKDFSDEQWKQIQTALDEVLKEDSNPVAAFDADGTLWDIDLGETFFHFQIDHKLVSLPPSPWEYYESTKSKNPETAYLWLAQICEHQKLEVIRQWAEEAINEHPPLPIFNPQKKLIELFLSKGVQIFIVTASVKWAVEPGARRLGLPIKNVLGVETSVENGIVTNQQNGVITYRQGKVEALMQATKGKKPFFCSGNTMGDYQLLLAATHLSMAVSAASRDDKLFKTECELQENAKKLNWLYHHFI